MEENKRNNVLDNLSENEKKLYEILAMVGDNDESRHPGYW